MIELKGVVKRLGRSEILRGVSLKLERGERVAVAGASGSGKTTLLRVISGLETQDSGEVWLRGANADGLGAFTRRVGFQFQDSALWPHMTLLENVAYGVGDDGERAMECLRRAGIAELAKRRPAEVSGGEARRAALARALAPRRDIVLLDEPLTNLPMKLRKEVARWIGEELEAAGATCVWVTHDAAESEGIVSRVLVMDEGELR